MGGCGATQISVVEDTVLSFSTLPSIISYQTAGFRYRFKIGLIFVLFRGVYCLRRAQRAFLEDLKSSISNSHVANERNKRLELSSKLPLSK